MTNRRSHSGCTDGATSKGSGLRATSGSVSSSEKYRPLICRQERFGSINTIAEWQVSSKIPTVQSVWAALLGLSFYGL